MRFTILFTFIGILLALFTWPASACEVEFRENNATEVAVLPGSSVTGYGAKHELLLVKVEQKHSAHHGMSDCCEEGCLCKVANCHHFSTLANLYPHYLHSKYAERYEFIVLAVPLSISSPPYRPPIA